ncbi:hypothetical protein Bhyg_14262 [Pseudolycoriella hygida]|uniref:Uncharacterized protein n=1 Tax=Pseudolycoriella hygida TaxID=35572 RepID=A0A9Q0MPP6_9DIPT|nr:hypothetical protein Bhyg_14262 [Pseudolycoriella hygida]
MCRLYSIKFIVTLNLIIFVAVPFPVSCVVHKVSFEPSKMFNECKNKLPPLQSFFDLSNLKMNIASDSTLFVAGSFSLIHDLDDPVVSVLTTTKQKLRGRWIDLPYTNYVKDFCAVYYKKGTYWNDHVTTYFVGDEKLCPPKKDLPLPINATLDLDLDLPTRMPNGEYMSTSVVKSGKYEACFEFTVEILQK